MEHGSNEQLPSLPTGVTWLIDDGRRSTAPHQLVLDQIATKRGEILWVDAQDVASTYALYSLASTPRQLESICIARAWTAYQHHTLVRNAVERASGRTRMLVFPHISSLYRDDDVDEHEADRLLAASLHTLAALSDALDLPVLITAPPTERDLLAPVVDTELRYESTAYGYTYAGEDFQTTIYHETTGWQTTIPYWVELFGAILRGEEKAWTASATHQGLETFV